MTSEGQEARSLMLSVAIHAGVLVIIAFALQHHPRWTPLTSEKWVSTELGVTEAKAPQHVMTPSRVMAPSSDVSVDRLEGDPAPTSPRTQYADALRARVDHALLEASQGETLPEGEALLELELDARGNLTSVKVGPDAPIELAILVRAAAQEASPYPLPAPDWLDARTGRLKMRLPVVVKSNSND